MDILSIFLTIILLFLFPLGQTLRLDIGGAVALNPLDIGVALTAFTTIIIAFLKKRRIPFIFVPVGLFILIGLAGLLLGLNNLLPGEFLVSSMYLVRFAFYASIGISVWLLSQNQKQFLMKILLVSGGIFLIAGFVQYFFFPSLWGLIYAGWDPHLYRMFSTFLDPNFAGVFLSLYLLLVVHTFFQQKLLVRKIIFAVLGFFILLAIVLTYSRTTYVMTLIELLVYFSFIGFRYVLYIFIGILLIISFILSPLVHKYGEGVNLLRTVSANARITDDMNAVNIWSRSPLFGVGFDAYRYAQHRYHIISGFNWEDTHSGAGVSNSFLFVLATTGVLGGIVFGYFWLMILKRAFVLRKTKLGIFLFSSFVALLVSSLFENTLFYPSIMLWMWILVGLMG